ncbi:hypothetical protein EPN44_01435 [bacterium]|nr:MAG: hypothetical protein EPN44_01435 [bacterium]
MQKTGVRKQHRRWATMFRIGAALLLAAGLLVVVQLVRQSQQQPAGLSLSVESPASGGMVSNPVRFAFKVGGARLGAPEQGLDHLHISLDGGPEVGVYQDAFSAPLPAGQHTVVAELADALHDSLGVSARVTFTVTEPAR